MTPIVFGDLNGNDDTRPRLVVRRGECADLLDEPRGQTRYPKRIHCVDTINPKPSTGYGHIHERDAVRFFDHTDPEWSNRCTDPRCLCDWRIVRRPGKPREGAWVLREGHWESKVNRILVSGVNHATLDAWHDAPFNVRGTLNSIGPFNPCRVPATYSMNCHRDATQRNHPNYIPHLAVCRFIIVTAEGTTIPSGADCATVSRAMPYLGRFVSPLRHDDCNRCRPSGLSKKRWKVWSNELQYPAPDETTSAFRLAVARRTCTTPGTWVEDLIHTSKDGRLEYNLEARCQYPPSPSRTFVCLECSRRAGHPVCVSTVYRASATANLCFDCATNATQDTLERSEVGRELVDPAGARGYRSPRRPAKIASDNLGGQITHRIEGPRASSVMCDLAPLSRDVMFRIPDDREKRIRIRPSGSALPMLLPDDEDSLRAEIASAAEDSDTWVPAHREDRATLRTAQKRLRVPLDGPKPVPVPMVTRPAKRPYRKAANFHELSEGQLSVWSGTGPESVHGPNALGGTTQRVDFVYPQLSCSTREATR